MNPTLTESAQQQRWREQYARGGLCLFVWDNGVRIGMAMKPMECGG